MESPKIYWNILKMWVMLFWRHSLILIKWDWGKIVPTIEKWPTLRLTIKKPSIVSHRLKYEYKENMLLT